MRVYAMDVSPDDSYFVVTAGSGGDLPPTSDTAMAFPVGGGEGVQPLWISRHFDSVYSVAITEKAVYLGGHFSWQPSPTAPDPYPGLQNVGYGTGQGLSGYGLGDEVVKVFHLGAVDPKTGKSLGGWDPESNSFTGDKAMLATPAGLFVGGDGMLEGRAAGRPGRVLRPRPAARGDPGRHHDRQPHRGADHPRRPALHDLRHGGRAVGRQEGPARDLRPHGQEVPAAGPGHLRHRQADRRDAGRPGCDDDHLDRHPADRAAR